MAEILQKRLKDSTSLSNCFELRGQWAHFEKKIIRVATYVKIKKNNCLTWYPLYRLKIKWHFQKKSKNFLFTWSMWIYVWVVFIRLFVLVNAVFVWSSFFDLLCGSCQHCYILITVLLNPFLDSLIFFTRYVRI